MLEQGKAHRFTLFIQSIGEHGSNVQIDVKETQPADLLVEFTPTRTLLNGVNRSKMMIVFPDDAKVCNYDGLTEDNLGHVVLTTTHPDFPEIFVFGGRTFFGGNSFGNSTNVAEVFVPAQDGAAPRKAPGLITGGEGV